MKTYLFTSYEDAEAQLLFDFMRNPHIGQDSEEAAKAIEIFTNICPAGHKVYKVEFSMLKDEDLLTSHEVGE